jgi:hypothetical protein
LLIGISIPSESSGLTVADEIWTHRAHTALVWAKLDRDSGQTGVSETRSRQNSSIFWWHPTPIERTSEREEWIGMNLNWAKRANGFPKRITDLESRCKKFLSPSEIPGRLGKFAAMREGERELLIERERERGGGENKKKTEVEETWKGMEIGREWCLRRSRWQP